MCDILLSSCETSRGCRHQTENQVLQPCTENAEMLRPLLHPGSVGRRPPIQPPHLPRGMAARLLRGGEGQQHGSSALALARVCAQATHRAASPKPRTKGGPLPWDRTPSSRWRAVSGPAGSTAEEPLATGEMPAGPFTSVRSGAMKLLEESPGSVSVTLGRPGFLKD